MIKIEKRRTVNPVLAIVIGILSVLAGLLISIAILNLSGYDALSIYAAAFKKTFTTRSGLMETIVTWIPIVLCSLSAIIAAKVSMWNLGIEGQFYMGAFAATAISLLVPGGAWVKIPLMLIAAAIAGGILAIIVGVLKFYLHISDILSSVLLNKIAYFWVLYVSSVMWKDTTTGAVQTPIFDKASQLPILIRGTRVHVGILVAIALLIILEYVLRYRPAGYAIRTIGNNPKAAKYAGINIGKYIVISMLLAGGIAGIAGMLEVSGVAHRLQIAIHNEYGFGGFVVAWISRLSIPVSAVVSFLFSGLSAAGYFMQMSGLPSAIVDMLRGLILIICVACELLLYYDIKIVPRKKPEEPGDSSGEKAQETGKEAAEA